MTNRLLRIYIGFIFYITIALLGKGSLALTSIPLSQNLGFIGMVLIAFTLATFIEDHNKKPIEQVTNGQLVLASGILFYIMFCAVIGYLVNKG